MGAPEQPSAHPPASVHHTGVTTSWTRRCRAWRRRPAFSTQTMLPLLAQAVKRCERREWGAAMQQCSSSGWTVQGSHRRSASTLSSGDVAVLAAGAPAPPQPDLQPAALPAAAVASGVGAPDIVSQQRVSGMG